ncbi:hypothetical protein [Enterococcus sp. LJL51]|uniref:hypothetical protein n=1 Tax=Enterococcus sp. LJL51 TaxID=3416656 RepID=UPI003CE81461
MKKKFVLIGIAVVLLAGCSGKSKETESTKTESSNSSSVSRSTTKETASKATDETISGSESVTSDASSVDADYPYTVPVTAIQNIVFANGGMNVPQTIGVNFTNESNGKITFEQANPDAMFTTVYSAAYQQIPTKTIRIFSEGANGIRTVSVNTELVMGTKVEDGNGINLEGNMYVFYNNNGGISLITPNYAGNVAVEDMDVMLEYLVK